MSFIEQKGIKNVLRLFCCPTKFELISESMEKEIIKLKAKCIELNMKRGNYFNDSIEPEKVKCKKKNKMQIDFPEILNQQQIKLFTPEKFYFLLE